MNEHTHTPEKRVDELEKEEGGCVQGTQSTLCLMMFFFIIIAMTKTQGSPPWDIE
jgi:hypothetical protein